MVISANSPQTTKLIDSQIFSICAKEPVAPFTITIFPQDVRKGNAETRLPIVTAPTINNFFIV